MWHGICYFFVAEYIFKVSVIDNDKYYCEIMNVFFGFSLIFVFLLYLANKKVQEKLDNLFLKANPFNKKKKNLMWIFLFLKIADVAF